MSKNWGEKNSITPVIYTPTNGFAPKLIKLFFEINKLNKDSEFKKINDSLETNFQRLLTKMKPLEGTIIDKDKPIKKEFYQENEWRYVPPTFSVILPNEEKKIEEKK